MSYLNKLVLVFLTLTFMGQTAAFAQNTNVSRYKCMIQMTNYVGDGAYIVISLIDGKGAYEKTLYVLGSNKKWYSSLKEWSKYVAQRPTKLSGITGASVPGGDRSVQYFEFDNSKMNAGYKIRFETAVEDKAYYLKDLEIPLTTENLSIKNEGTGVIRFVRFTPN